MLHFAPERGISRRIVEIVGLGYDCRDLEPSRYKRSAVLPTQFNLCKDVDQLPSNHYDLVLHNHVMEHVPCNVTAVLWHLHRALHPDGLHMFSVPIFAGKYDESLDPIGEKEAIRRFRQHDHVRVFGRGGLADTIGMVFDIEEQVTMGLADHFSEADLHRYCIPKGRWSRFSGASLFVLRKRDLKLAC